MHTLTSTVFLFLLVSTAVSHVAGNDDEGPKTPGEKLLDAAGFGDFDDIVKLIKDGADVNFGNEFGETPLHLASIKSDLRIVCSN